MISKQTSINYQTAKVASIFLVVFGHFHEGLELFWVTVTVGLLVFSYSSGYFTAEKYKEGYDKINFWKKKFTRIGLKLLFADFFLIILFIVQKKPDILTWQTIVSALGLTGLLNWFHISNTTPFGAGLWFLTLLYIFYIAYPLLIKVTTQKKQALIFCFCYSILMWILNYAIPYGHMVWLTSAGFVWGVVVRRIDFHMKWKISFIFLCLSFILMVLFNVLFSIKIFNVILILACSLFLMFLLEDIKIPEFMIQCFSFFSGTILYIYILHPYLFLKIVASNFWNVIISIIFVLIICKGLELIFTKIILHKVREIEKNNHPE